MAETVETKTPGVAREILIHKAIKWEIERTLLFTEILLSLGFYHST